METTGRCANSQPHAPLQHFINQLGSQDVGISRNDCLERALMIRQALSRVFVLVLSRGQTFYLRGNQKGGKMSDAIIITSIIVAGVVLIAMINEWGGGRNAD